MINQKCAICGKANYAILYPANFDPKKIDEKTFSARRLPDRIHYQMVKCRKCGLVYSSPILEREKIEKLYKKSFVSYDEQLENLIETYGYYLKKLKLPKKRKERLLEIGCGNGFFLEEALRQGYSEVYGVEPGVASAGQANKEIRKNIIVDIFKKDQFKNNFFDVICCFQTLDHLIDPNGVLSECYKILKKGGLVLFFNHDVESLSAKLLKDKSPIIDIEHIYLFSKKTMRQIFEKHKFTIIEIKGAKNVHFLNYWIYLFPLPQPLKKTALKIFESLRLDKLKIRVNPGNLYLTARKK